MPSFLSKIIDWFKHDNTQVDDNTFVTSIGRDEYEYREGSHRLRVQTELLSGNPDIVVYAGTIKKWLPPYQDEPLTSADKERILEKVCQYLDKIKVSYEIDNT